jgi:hypothetical protein
VKFFGAISALYLGIYLILPGCLCQLLEAFGVPVHPSKTLVHECVVSGASDSIPCHCLEISAKTAEPENHLTLVPQDLLLSDEIAAMEAFLVPPTPRNEATAGRAPPPLASIHLNSLRTFTGVYLL